MDAVHVGVDSCPKDMVFGPCADVNPDGSCEVPVASGGPVMCPFVKQWDATDHLRFTATRTGSLSGSDSASFLRVMTEFPDVGRDGPAIRSMARKMAGVVDAVLFGDSNWSRVQFPPSYRAALMEQEGLRTWPGLNARDRNRVALEGELLALRDIGVAGVHCVTGNHPYAGDRPDAQPVFDLDSTRMAELASGIGLPTSVAASPHSRPISLRPVVTYDKGVAGASVCFIDQPTNPEDVAAFIQAVRAIGPTSLTFMPVITIVTSPDDFTRWSQFSNARVPDGWTETLARATGPVAEVGLSLAVDFARSMLQVDGVSGVLFSCTSTPAKVVEVAAVFRDAAEAIRTDQIK